MGRAQRTNWRERAVAVAIAALLTAAWTVADWARLSALILPDPDDMMRLVQIRDWIGGQPFADLTQHRLGGGLAMHWSRLPDLVPAALILLLEPLTGRHAAELAAVILWPGALFALTLCLLASIARRLADRGAGITALLLGAIAYPATGFYMPGRIDHHGLQLVLLLVGARAMMGPRSIGSGTVIGLVVAASLSIGLESAPLCAILLAILCVRWMFDTNRGGELAACGGALGICTGAAALLLSPRIWPAALCDAFTPPIAILGVAAGGLLMLLALAGLWLRGAVARGVALGIAGAAGLGLAVAFAPVCLAGPYGAVSPLLRALWLDHVAEAQPLLAAPAGVVIGYGGMMIAGVVAMAARLWRGPRPVEAIGWFALQLAALVLACVQLRLAPFGAALAVPVLAAMVTAARAGGSPLRRVGAWAVSAGILYPLLGSSIGSGYAEPPRAPCLTPANLRAIAALGPVRVAVPLDMGAYVIAASQAQVLAAPYHRNGEANLAHYRLFLASAETARATARRWGIGAIAYCPGWVGDLDPMGVAAPDSIVRRGIPTWAAPVHVTPDLVVIEVRP